LSGLIFSSPEYPSGFTRTVGTQGQIRRREVLEAVGVKKPACREFPDVRSKPAISDGKNDICFAQLRFVWSSVARQS
jgi:hypothetical protein